MKDDGVLSKCWFCNSPAVELHPDPHDSFVDWWVECVECDAQGPKRDSEGEARDAWNNPRKHAPKEA